MLHKPILGASGIQHHVTGDIVIHVVSPRQFFVGDDVDLFVESRKHAGHALGRHAIGTGKHFILGATQQFVSKI